VKIIDSLEQIENEGEGSQAYAQITLQAQAAR
jgi:hypothetical protein